MIKLASERFAAWRRPLERHAYATVNDAIDYAGAIALMLDKIAFVKVLKAAHDNFSFVYSAASE